MLHTFLFLCMTQISLKARHFRYYTVAILDSNVFPWRLYFSFCCYCVCFSNFSRNYPQNLPFCNCSHWCFCYFIFYSYFLASLGSPSCVNIACWLARDWTDCAQVSVACKSSILCRWMCVGVGSMLRFQLMFKFVSFYFPSVLLISPLLMCVSQGRLENLPSPSMNCLLSRISPLNFWLVCCLPQLGSQHPASRAVGLIFFLFSTIFAIYIASVTGQ